MRLKYYAAVATLAAAAVTPALSAATANADTSIHLVPCGSSSYFTVHYDFNTKSVCYFGTGTILVAIPKVVSVDTGLTSGNFRIQNSSAFLQTIFFTARQHILVNPPDTAEIVAIDIVSD